MTYHCPYCEKELEKGELGYFCQPCQFSVPFVYRGQRLSEEILSSLLLKGKSIRAEWKRHDTGKHFIGHLELTKAKTIRLIPTYLDGVICPLCKKSILETPLSWECESGDVQVWKKMASRSISKREVRQLFLYRKSDLLAGFVSQETGKRFSAALSFSESGEVVFEFK